MEQNYQQLAYGHDNLLSEFSFGVCYCVRVSFAKRRKTSRKINYLKSTHLNSRKLKIWLTLPISMKHLCFIIWSSVTTTNWSMWVSFSYITNKVSFFLSLSTTTNPPLCARIIRQKISRKINSNKSIHLSMKRPRICPIWHILMMPLCFITWSRDTTISLST